MKRLLALITVGAVLAFAQAADPGVTDTEVLLGSWGPQSGPAAAWGTVNIAIDAYFRYLNDQGGINGRKLVLSSRDDGYDPARTVGAVRELIDRDNVFAFVAGVGTANGQAAMPLIKRAGTPWVGPATGAVVFTDESDGLIFTSFTDYVVEATLMTRHAVETLGSKNIAIFYQNDGYGEEGLRGLEAEVARLQAAGYDVTIGDRVSYERGTTNQGVQALRLRGSGADTVLMFSDPSAAATLVGEFQRLDYTPQMLASVTLLDPALMANPAMQGALFSVFLRLPSVIVGEGNGDPIADQLYRDVILAYAPEIARDPFRALAGIAFAEPAVLALQAAGRDLTRESFVEALKGIDGYDTGLYHSLSFKDGYQGNNSVMLLQVTPQGLRPVSDWLSL
ncbi:MAG: ABC transporter substrate-binding protein [Trueperaceae bacterium]|nr:ABC transporter substrate-binding protein [Trueperaceae bacterium]MCO5173782.1 ABC transporter substrate-binding protein [Trueperaceae bacterium]MCW5819006.1 ABC transporter substrate-binding protein [Trueperaceae bacterium]